MTKESPLKDKMVLVVEDEPDVLETVADELDMCIVHKAKDYDTALQYLMSYTYDVVILDIMGVNGFELLKMSVRENSFGHADCPCLTQDALKKSIKLGALSFLPKEKMNNLTELIEDVVLGTGKPLWIKFFDKLDTYLNKRFGRTGKRKTSFSMTLRNPSEKASR